MMLKTMFAGADKPPKLPKPPRTDSAAVQAEQDAARRRSALASGRSSTILTGLGNVGGG